MNTDCPACHGQTPPPGQECYLCGPSVVVPVALLKPTWPIWKAIETLMATRCLHGNAALEIQGKSFEAHLVLVPSERLAEFTALIHAFNEAR